MRVPVDPSTLKEGDIIYFTPSNEEHTFLAQSKEYYFTTTKYNNGIRTMSKSRFCPDKEVPEMKWWGRQYKINKTIYLHIIKNNTKPKSPDFQWIDSDWTELPMPKHPQEEP